jgi:uncharacterized protein (DUF1697 family)
MARTSEIPMATSSVSLATRQRDDFKKNPIAMTSSNPLVAVRKSPVMQHSFIALLRGINVGKANRIAMADLRALMEVLGYTSVTTLLNSGNAVFRAGNGSSAKHAAAIAGAIATQWKLELPVVVKSARELAAIAADNPWSGTAPDHSRLMVAFAQDDTALAGLRAISPAVVAPEEFFIGSHAAYLHCVSGILESKAGKALLGKAGQAVTTRNWATVLKLQALVGQDAT